jgi:hypothetical protein
MNNEQENIISETQNTQSFETNVETNFFYTLDKFINSLDNNKIIFEI